MKKRIKNADSLEMLRTGEQFFKCANLCIEKGNEMSYACMNCVTPAAVNAALSCEIFLKLLLYLHEIEYPKEHRLKELFKELPRVIKENIKADTIKRYGSWENLWGLAHLDNVSNTFNDWRYNFEHDFSKERMMRLEMGFLFALMETLKDECNKYFEIYINGGRKR